MTGARVIKLHARVCIHSCGS